MKKVEEYYSSIDDDSETSKLMAVVTGLQPLYNSNEKKTWVLNHDVHITEDGEVLAPQCS